MSRTTTNFSILLLSLSVLFLLGPFLEGNFVWSLVYHVTMTGIYISALLANRHHRIVFRIGVASLVVLIALTWLDLVVDSRPLDVANRLIGAVYLLFTAGLFLIAVFRQHTGTPSALFGVVIVYLLIGLAWAALYQSIDMADPQAFHIPERRTVALSWVGPSRTSFSQMVYFSFVTMSTLGYGDVSPRSPAAETATWLQATFGQFFLAAIVARLVSLLPERRAPTQLT